MSTLLLLALGCSGPTTPDAPTDVETDTDTDADSDTDTDTDADTDTTYDGHSGTTATTAAPTAETAAPFEVDCAALTNRPISFRTLTGARGYHDVAITQDPFIIGQDVLGTLIKAPYMQPGTPLVPGIGTVQGMDWLPNGDLAVARSLNSTVSRVNPVTGGLSVITQVPGEVYGVITGPDGMLYVADQVAGRIYRVDPATGNKTELVNRPPLHPRVINFSPDYSKMYIGTYIGDNTGRVYFVDLDASLTPISDVQLFASGVGTGSYHDALQVDFCGNLYMTDYSMAAMYKIDPQGNVIRYLDMPNGQYGHGARFGNGIGGFRLDALYVPQPYHGNTVAEIIIGVPSRTWDGTPF